MDCFCCKSIIEIARKVKVRRLIKFDPKRGGSGSPHYMAYIEETTYCWSVICNPCYILLDSPDGTCVIDEKRFNIAGSSRFDRARTIRTDEYVKWQKKEAAKLGLDLSSDQGK